MAEAPGELRPSGVSWRTGDARPSEAGVPMCAAGLTPKFPGLARQVGGLRGPDPSGISPAHGRVEHRAFWWQPEALSTGACAVSGTGTPPANAGGISVRDAAASGDGGAARAACATATADASGAGPGPVRGAAAAESQSTRWRWTGSR